MIRGKERRTTERGCGLGGWEVLGLQFICFVYGENNVSNMGFDGSCMPRQLEELTDRDPIDIRSRGHPPSAGAMA